MEIPPFNCPVLVIGGGVNALGILRNLGRNGIDTFYVSGSETIALHSRYCNGYTIFPGIQDSQQKLEYFLQKFMDKMNTNIVVFPTGDESALNFSILKKKLKNYVSTVPNFNILQNLIVKSNFYRSLRESGIPHPLTIFPDLIQDKNEDRLEISFPVFIKPSLSPSFFKIFKCKGFIAYSRSQLHRYLHLINHYEIDVVIQEIIPGPISSYYSIDGYFDHSSNPKALFARRTLRKPSNFDNSSACVSLPLSEVSNMCDVLVRYLQSIRYYGIFHAEFKMDPRDNVGKLIEINARSWWFNSFPSACGINIILMAYLEAIGEEVPLIRDYETGMKFIWFLRDLHVFRRNLQNRMFTLSAFLSSYVGKTHWIILAQDDPKPFLMEILGRIKQKVSR
jgi:predicted ATP-grasp superfamily ATP-dependent carboligase